MVRPRDLLQYLCQHVLGHCLGDLRLGRQDQTVGAHIREDIGHIVRQHVVPALHEGPALAHAAYCQRTAGTDAQHHQRVATAGLRQTGDIFQHGVRHMYLLGLGLHGQQVKTG